MTAEGLLAVRDLEHRYELVRGELRTLPFAGAREGLVTADLCFSLMSHVRRHGLVLNRVGFHIEHDPDTVLAPNVAFVRPERSVDTPDYFRGAPDLAIDVIGPNDGSSDIEERIADWLRAGVCAVILVNPRLRAVRMHRASGAVKVEDVLEVDDIVPRWRLPLSELFAWRQP